ncbi:unnamed protein product, partial [Rotaria sordida]
KTNTCSRSIQITVANASIFRIFNLLSTKDNDDNVTLI